MQILVPRFTDPPEKPPRRVSVPLYRVLGPVQDGEGEAGSHSEETQRRAVDRGGRDEFVAVLR